MRQPISSEIMKILSDYHVYLRKLFNEGRLHGKITAMMEAKCDELHVSFRSYWRNR